MRALSPRNRTKNRSLAVASWVRTLQVAPNRQAKRQVLRDCPAPLRADVEHIAAARAAGVPLTA